MVPLNALTIIQSLAGLGLLICFILVLVQMFQHGETGLGILCIVLAFCASIGFWIAFILGWVRASKWGINNLMIIWTILLIVEIALIIVSPPPFPVNLPAQ